MPVLLEKKPRHVLDFFGFYRNQLNRKGYSMLPTDDDSITVKVHNDWGCVEAGGPAMIYLKFSKRRQGGFSIIRGSVTPYGDNPPYVEFIFDEHKRPANEYALQFNRRLGVFNNSKPNVI